MNQTDRVKLMGQIFAGVKVEGKKVIGEWCTCGHTRLDHEDTLSLGHGSCAVKDCTCRQFTWESWVLA